MKKWVFYFIGILQASSLRSVELCSGPWWLIIAAACIAVITADNLLED